MIIQQIEENVGKRVKTVLESEQVTSLYTNGFIIFVGQSDMGVILQKNGKDTAVINMSFTLAKTLAEKLGNTVREFEEKTGTLIMTTDVVNERTMKEGGKEESNES